MQATDALKHVCGILMLGLLSSAAVAQNLYSPERYVSLVSDHRASTIGDPVTVLIVESSSAEAAASSNRDRGVDFDAGVEYPAGTAAVGLNLERDERGSGRTTREGELRARVTATVVEVTPNNMLRIEADQVIVVNGERQRIALSGLVRPIDIHHDNTILSTRMADVDLRYDGKGFVHDGQRPGLFGRLLSWLGL